MCMHEIMELITIFERFERDRSTSHLRPIEQRLQQTKERKFNASSILFTGRDNKSAVQDVWR